MTDELDTQHEAPDEQPQEQPNEANDDDDTPDGATPDGEPGPADDEQVENDDDEQPQEQPQPAQSQKDIEAKVRKLERASESYTKKVAEVLGDDLADYVPTPLSESFLFGFVVRPDLRPLPDEVVQATKLLIGEPIQPPFKETPSSQTCPDCEGWGQVLTGSHVHGKQTMTCRTCGGRGAVGSAYDVTPADMAAHVNGSTVFTDGDTPTPLPEDNWGTPLGHPDYGKLPQFREPGWAEALDAYKRGEAAPVA